MQSLNLVEYARISTHFQNQTSIEDQIKRMALWAEAFTHTITHQFSDISSGSNRARIGFNGALNCVLTCFCHDCKAPSTFESHATFEFICANCAKTVSYGAQCYIFSGKDTKADGLIVSHLDRFARDMKHTIDIMEQFGKAGKVLVIHELGLASSTDAGKMVLGVMASMAEFQRRQSAAKSKSVVQNLREAGKYACGGPKYGESAVYYWQSGKKVSEHRTVENVDETKAIRRIRTLYLRGNTFTQIADILNAEGYLTKYKKAFRHDSVSRVVDREGLRRQA